MTLNALLVGHTPSAIKDGLEIAGFNVSTQELLSEPRLAGIDLLVIHESAQPAAEESDATQDWLVEAGEVGALRLYHADSYDDRRIAQRIILDGVEFFSEGQGPPPDQIASILAAIQGKARPAVTTDLTLGTYFAPDDPSVDAYEARRKLSMVTPAMQELIRDVRFAVARMMGTGARNWPEPPWDPFDRVMSRLEAKEPRLDKHTGKPRLSDLYAAPGDEKVRAMLGADPETLDRARRDHVQATMALIRGESGTGKTLAAELMWQSFALSTDWARDDRAQMPYVKVNCGGMRVDNFDHIMLGSGPDQFTGVKSRVGHLGRADYGLLFLDEIGDLSPQAQSRMKPLLDDLIIEPPGLFAYPLHARIVAATNVDLENASKGFQHDLLRRFNIQVYVPPLNDRSADEKLLQIDFVAQLPTINPRDHGQLLVRAIDKAVIELLLDHDWSHGNFRELQEVVQAAVTSARKRRSVVVERRDIVFGRKAAPTDERIVELVDDSLPARPSMIVRSRDDLLKASNLLNAPIFRLADGTEVVVADSYQLRLPAPGPARAHRESHGA